MLGAARSLMVEFNEFVVDRFVDYPLRLRASEFPYLVGVGPCEGPVLRKLRHTGQEFIARSLGFTEHGPVRKVDGQGVDLGRVGTCSFVVA